MKKQYCIPDMTVLYATPTDVFCFVSVESAGFGDEIEFFESV